MLSELHSKLNRSSSQSDHRYTTSDWQDGDTLTSGRLNRTIDESGIIKKSSARQSQTLRSITGLAKVPQPYQLESKNLSRFLISGKTALNREKVASIGEYIFQAQNIDSVFSDMKAQANETREEQIIDTLIKCGNQNNELTKKLMDIEALINQTSMDIDNARLEVAAGTVHRQELAEQLDNKKEKQSREKLKNEKVTE